MHFRPVNEATAALPGTELPERNCDDCRALSGSCSCCPGEVTSKSFLHFSVNQEKMEPLNGKVSRESPKQDGPGSRDTVSQRTRGLALPLVPAAFPGPWAGCRHVGGSGPNVASSGFTVFHVLLVCA